MLVKVKTKILIHYQSSSPVAQRLKQNTYNMLNLPQKGFECSKEQIIHKFERSQSLNRTYLYKPFGDKQIRYVGGGTCLKCLSPLGKPSASPLGMCKVTPGVAQRPVSHMCGVSDLWRGMVSHKSLTCVCKLKNQMLRQPVK